MWLNSCVCVCACARVFEREREQDVIMRGVSTASVHGCVWISCAKSAALAGGPSCVSGASSGHVVPDVNAMVCLDEHCSQGVGADQQLPAQC